MLFHRCPGDGTRAIVGSGGAQKLTRLAGDAADLSRGEGQRERT